MFGKFAQLLLLLRFFQLNTAFAYRQKKNLPLLHFKGLKLFGPLYIRNEATQKNKPFSEMEL